MAQTKRKRRSTKHRGNAAGIIEARGRTSHSQASQPGRKGKPGERFDKPPSWQSSAQRAAFAAVIFGLMLVFLFKQEPLPAAGLTAGVFLFYVPLGYYTDSIIYKRRVRKKAAG
ncbi:MAG TPA: hypothetical protein VNT22_02470, partial [Baekduia sp.]|nr:hypothetical protein [Baekduia sp.]